MFRIIQTIRIDEIRSASVRARHLEVVRNDAEVEAQRSDNIGSQMGLEEIRRQMDRLPDQQRTALMLVCVEGYSYKEAAEIMNVPMGTVTSRVTRGRLALLAQNDDEDHDD